MKMVWIALLAVISGPAMAQAPSAEFIEAAKICFTKFPRGPHMVNPASLFMAGWEKCEKIVQECAKTHPNCVDQDAADKAAAADAQDKQKVESVAGKMK